ncbi:MAG: hypothetical protein CFE21_00935 [Bacteroidetes bacterium B1(2017)]|nr:MAG: hypothetical protein CFE21_00935 [Bacteroidetes bacterium B1(2017)]
MKKVLHPILLGLLIILNSSFKTELLFGIEIWQHGKPVKISKQVVLLDKEPFQIKVSLYKQEGVFVNASVQENYFKLQDSEPIANLADWPANTFAESTFNVDQDLILDSEGVGYWFYNKKKDWHRFDSSVVLGENVVIGTKSISHFFVPSVQKTMDISDIKSPIYLFLVAAKEGRKIKELQRQKIMIIWK